jgi:RNase H-fold protein (predicted Holliday junction resolvase)
MIALKQNGSNKLEHVIVGYNIDFDNNKGRTIERIEQFAINIKLYDSKYTFMAVDGQGRLMIFATSELAVYETKSCFLHQ